MGEEKSMRKKIICILVMTLLISLALTSTATFLTNKNVNEKTINLTNKSGEETSVNINSDNEQLTDSEMVTNKDTIYLDIPACAFVAEGKTADYHLSNAGSISCNGYGFFYAPVYLPKDAEIYELAAWWKDSSQESGVVSLYRYHPVFQYFDFMAEVESIGDQNNYHWDNTVTIEYPKITDSYMYWLSLSLSPGVQCYGARVAYFSPVKINSETNMLND